ncbi:MAG TPA: fimbrial protein [Scandinavium sp.]|uniref:fimbrial protein n=1 Tax=Scandinavium sp. TaxID=2830653 RepID=UPI002E30A75D|nr:fimbrial protein [Scandinavium sp.]HEX4503371.1 fimbrial protein [Scandinavium sp.]
MKIYRCIWMIGLAVLPLMTQADPTINVSGNVIASPCTVDTGTVTKLVELGTVNKQDLPNAGDGGVWSDFDLLVSNCPTGTSKVTAIFTGTPDIEDSTAWKNSGTSSNVALRLSSRDHNTVYSNSSTMLVNVDSTTHKTTFPLSARIFTPKGNVVAGTFASVMKTL